MLNRRTVLSLAAAAVAAAGFAALPPVASPALAAEEAPEAIGIDWAYYNPVAILLKNKGWLEEEFAADGTEIRWVLSLGSNKALEFLRARSVDFGSTAGGRSEEHTSELQSLMRISYAVFCLKKKTHTTENIY